MRAHCQRSAMIHRPLESPQPQPPIDWRAEWRSLNYRSLASSLARYTAWHAFVLSNHSTGGRAAKQSGATRTSPAGRAASGGAVASQPARKRASRPFRSSDSIGAPLAHNTSRPLLGGRGASASAAVWWARERSTRQTAKGSHAQAAAAAATAQATAVLCIVRHVCRSGRCLSPVLRADSGQLGSACQLDLASSRRQQARAAERAC